MLTGLASDVDRVKATFDSCDRRIYPCTALATLPVMRSLADNCSKAREDDTFPPPQSKRVYLLSTQDLYMSWPKGKAYLLILDAFCFDQVIEEQHSWSL